MGVKRAALTVERVYPCVPCRLVEAVLGLAQCLFKGVARMYFRASWNSPNSALNVKVSWAQS